MEIEIGTAVCEDHAPSSARKELKTGAPLWWSFGGALEEARRMGKSGGRERERERGAAEKQRTA